MLFISSNKLFVIVSDILRVIVHRTRRTLTRSLSYSSKDFLHPITQSTHRFTRYHSREANFAARVLSSAYLKKVNLLIPRQLSVPPTLKFDLHASLLIEACASRGGSSLQQPSTSHTPTVHLRNLGTVFSRHTMAM